MTCQLNLEPRTLIEWTKKDEFNINLATILYYLHCIVETARCTPATISRSQTLGPWDLCITQTTSTWCPLGGCPGRRSSGWAGDKKLCLYSYNFFVGSVWVQKWRLVIRRDPLGDPYLRTRAAIRTAEWQGGGWEPPGDRGHEEHGGGPAPALQLPQGRVRAHAGVLGNTHRGQAGLSSKYTQQYLTFINKCYYRKYHSFFWGKILVLTPPTDNLASCDLILHLNQILITHQSVKESKWWCFFLQIQLLAWMLTL